MIYLLRHADARPDDGSGDAARPLSGKGRAQADAAGRAISRLGYSLDTCLTSPKSRALETATIVCGHLGLKPEICQPIAQGYYDTLELVAGRGEVILVGHEPDMSSEVTRLTGACIRLKKCGLAVVDGHLLKALLRPSELAAMAGD
jgi:phosphohistidine phosphatase